MAQVRFWRILRRVPRPISRAIGHVERVGAHEDEVGGLDGDVGAGADGDAEVGLGEGGGVVDAVADHGDPGSVVLEARRPRRPCRRGGHRR